MVTALPATAATRVLILPFGAPGDTGTMASLGMGTMDSLITALSHVPEFVVVDRATIDQVLKEQAFQQTGLVDPATSMKLGKLLGVQAIISGRVQVAGDRVRLSASFIEAETGRVRRAEQVTGGMSEVFDLQDQLASRFMADQKVTVSTAQAQQVSTSIKSTTNLKAYEAYQQGQAWYQLTTAPAYEQALIWYDTALQADPQYALAYSGKAAVIAVLTWMNEKHYHATTVSIDDGVRAVEQALKLQPDLAAAHRALALMLTAQKKPGGLDAAHRATDLAPNDADTWLAEYVALGHTDPEAESLKHALRLNPRSILAHVQRGIALAYRGHMSEANAEADISLALYPQSDTAHFMVAMTQMATGHPVRAVEAFQRAVKLNPRNAAAFNYLGDALKSLSRYDEAMVAYRDALRLQPDYRDPRESMIKLQRAAADGQN